MLFRSKEDSEHHGRLVEIQNLLLKFDDRVLPLGKEIELLFYLNELKVLKKYKDNTPKEVKHLQSFRNHYMYYENWKALFDETNPEQIRKRILPNYKTAIKAKKGIFPDESNYRVVSNKIDDLDRKYSKQGTIFKNEFSEMNNTDRMRIHFESKP